jgi:hypothetical protein
MANPVKVNPLGQISDSVVEELKTTGTQVAGQVVSEPAKILEQILGGSSSGKVSSDAVGELGVEQGQTTATGTSATGAADAALLAKKQQVSDTESAALYALHKQRLAEEEQYYQMRKQEKKQEELTEEKQEEEKKQIVQLQKEQEDDAVWQQQLKAVQGSHEAQQGKM